MIFDHILTNFINSNNDQFISIIEGKMVHWCKIMTQSKSKTERARIAY